MNIFTSNDPSGSTGTGPNKINKSLRFAIACIMMIALSAFNTVQAVNTYYWNGAGVVTGTYGGLTSTTGTAMNAYANWVTYNGSTYALATAGNYPGQAVGDIVNIVFNTPATAAALALTASVTNPYGSLTITNSTTMTTSEVFTITTGAFTLSTTGNVTMTNSNAASNKTSAVEIVVSAGGALNIGGNLSMTNGTATAANKTEILSSAAWASGTPASTMTVTGTTTTVNNSTSGTSNVLIEAVAAGAKITFGGAVNIGSNTTGYYSELEFGTATDTMVFQGDFTDGYFGNVFGSTATNGVAIFDGTGTQNINDNGGYNYNYFPNLFIGNVNSPTVNVNFPNINSSAGPNLMVYQNMTIKAGSTLILNATGTTAGTVAQLNNYYYQLVGGASGGTFANNGTCVMNGTLYSNYYSATTPAGCNLPFGFTNTAGASSTYTFSSTLGAQTTLKTPTALNNLIINNSSGVTLSTTGTTIAGILTLTNGTFTTSATKTLTVNNTATTAVAGGSTTAYVNGPLAWKWPASLSSSASVYNFPVGNAGAYLPFSMTTLTTTATAPTVTVTATDAGSGGTVTAPLTSVSTTEYWTVGFSSAITSGKVSLTRQIAIGSANAIGYATALAGPYVNEAGTISGTSIINSNLISSPATTSYFAMATVPVAPTITSFSPSPTLCAGGGQTVTITGTGFAGTTGVTFNGTNATTFTVVSATSITAVTPSGLTAGVITVTNGAGSANSTSYTTTASPTITGNPVASSVAAYSSASTSFTAATSASSPTYQWEYATSTSGPWTAVTTGTPAGITYTGGTSATLGVASTPATPAGSAYYYECVITSGGCSSTTTSAQLTVTNYCASTGTATNTVAYITNVTTTGAAQNINNTSTYTAGGYTYYNLSPNVTQVAGSSVTVSVGLGGGSYTLGTGVSVYVDFNHNGVFTDAGEMVYSTNGYTTTSPVGGSFTVPGAAVVGNTTMRVVCNYNSSTPASCNSAVTQTETEDYVFVVTAPPAPTITSFTPTALCAGGGQTVTITGTNFTGASAVAFNGTAAASYTVVSATSITAVTPSGLTVGNITVTTGGGTATSPSGYTVNPSPTITTEPSATSVNAFNAATATMTVVASGTPTYQWYYSTASTGPWTAVANATPAGITYTGATSATLSIVTTNSAAAGTAYYECVVSASGCSSTTTSTLLTINNYCTPQAGTSDGIAGVSFNTISNLSTPLTAYTNYSSTYSTNVTLGSSYTLDVYVNTGGNYTNDQVAWIDWNQDGSFNTTAGSGSGLGEQYSLGTATNVTDGLSSLCPLTITVPATATLGTTRMRISSGYNATLTSCETGVDGGFQDYAIVVTAPVPNDAGVTAITASAACAGSATIYATVHNYGTASMSSVVVTSTPATSLSGTTFNASTNPTLFPIASGSSAVIPIGTYTLAGGTNSFTAATSLPSGATDGNPSNDSYSTSIAAGLNGTYSIPGNFATLTAAVAAYNALPICGPVVFMLTSSYTSSGETFPIVIGTNTGASSTNTLTIEPVSGATPSISGSSTTALIELAGASWVTINGSAGGSGSNQNLTIINTRTGTHNASSVIEIVNNSAGTIGSSNNTIENCLIQGSGSGATNTFQCIFLGGYGATVYSSVYAAVVGTYSVVPNNNNTIANNTINTAQEGLWFNGVNVTTPTETGNSINNNLIGSTTAANYLGGGMELDNEINFSVAGNTVTGGNGVGITLGSYISGGRIDSNYISNYTTTTSGNGVGGIFLATSTAATGTNIYNNMIWDMASGGFSTTSTTDYGLYNGNGIVVYEGGGYNIYFNTISLSVNQGAAAYSADIYICNIGGTGYVVPSGLTIENNILSNTETTGKTYGIYSNIANTVFTAIDYNDYYVAGATNAYVGYLGAAQSTLALWAAQTGKDSHSANIQPNFTSSTNLNLLNYDNFCLASGVAISGIFTDINGNSRVVPVMGADEINYTFSSTAVPDVCIGSAATATVVAPNALPAGSYTVTYNLTGANTHTGLTSTMVASAGTFSIPASDLTSTGSTTITITYLQPVTACTPVGSAFTIQPLPVTNVAADKATFNLQGAVTASIPGSHGTTAKCSSVGSYTIPTATVTNDASYLWSTSGTGSLSATTGTLAPTYTFGTGETGNVTITLTANAISPCSAPATDFVVINIQGSVTATIPGSHGTTAKCSSDGSYTIPTATVTNDASYLWSTSGTGSLSATSTTLAPTYTFGAGETGNVTITLTATAISPCSAPATDFVVINIQGSVTATIPGSHGTTAKCSSAGSYTIPTATVTNDASYTWSTSGTGSLSATTGTLAPTYTFGAGETGNVTITLTATAISPCSAPATDYIVISIQGAATASIPGSHGTTSMCSSLLSYTIPTGGAVTNDLSYSWSSSGTGLLTNTTSLTPTYTFGAGETGNVTITLTANGFSPCASASDYVIINIKATPAATASNTGPYIPGQTIILTSGPSGQTSYAWSGPNSFTASTENPTRASASSIMTGTYTVTITGSTGCSDTANTFVSVNALGDYVWTGGAALPLLQVARAAAVRMSSFPSAVSTLS